MSDIKSIAGQPLASQETGKNFIEKLPTAPPTPERIPVPEKHFEKRESQPEKYSEGSSVPERPGSKTAPVVPTYDYTTQAQIQRQKDIENILSDGLEEIYAQMDQATKNKFKIAGEETAKEINSLLGKAKIKAKKIIALIKKWLSIIPGVNIFFLEQEVKIKTDQIMKLRYEDKDKII